MPVWRSVEDENTRMLDVLLQVINMFTTRIYSCIASYTAGNARSTLQEVFQLNPWFIPHIPTELLYDNFRNPNICYSNIRLFDGFLC